MDHISNIIATIQQSTSKKKQFAEVVKTKFSIELCKVLFSEGFIAGYTIQPSGICIFLKYINGRPSMGSLIRISKRSKRVYWDFKELKKKCYGTDSGYYLVSTPQGLVFMSNLNVNNLEPCGGEVILKIS